jgi:hypothetical protein
MKFEISKNKGMAISLILVFGAIFLILFGGLVSLITFQLRLMEKRQAYELSLHIAEAGLEFYQWCINNQAPCGLSQDFKDAQGKKIGQFSLEVDLPSHCGVPAQRTIISTGKTEKFPEIKRKIKTSYAKPSVAQYAYLINDNVWAGSDREIRGLYHSNGGIRMDGENQSLVTSSQEEWVCTRSFGCFPCPTDLGCYLKTGQCLCPGVFGRGENKDLWQWPVPPFDFEGITLDLAQMKEISQADLGGLYLPPSKNLNPKAKGYHLKLKEDGTFEVWIITDLNYVLGYSLEEGWTKNYFIIEKEYLFNTYSLDPACSLIFLEDDLWIEGKLKGKATIISANLIDPVSEAKIILPANILYTKKDGLDGLTLISEGNILIGPQSPDKMELNGIFIAQKGRFGRNHYPWNIREKLEITGSIISNGRVGTKWSSGSQIVSGYKKRENYIDPNLVFASPPFTPNLSDAFQITSWQEVE